MLRILLAILAFGGIFSTGFSQIYTLDGNLGIGITPIERMDVDGNIRILGNSYLGGNVGVIGDLDVDGVLKLAPVQLNQGQTAFLQITADGTVTPMTDEILGDLLYTLDCGDGTVSNPVWNNGPDKIFMSYTGCSTQPKLGVGTSNPQYLLDVEGEQRNTGVAHFELGFEVGTANSVEFEPTIDGLSVNGGQVKFQNSSLDLSGTAINFDGDGSSDPILSIEDSSSSLFMINQDGSTEYHVDTQGTVSPITMYSQVDSNRIFEVNSSGHTICTTLRVREMGYFPDYVFDPEYKLMSIHDLEKYIKENNRLPNMPSAEDVATNGVNIGELNRLLVEKVEELSLYVIELNTRIVELEDGNDE